MTRLWTCPYCDHDCTIRESNETFLSDKGLISDEVGYVEAGVVFTVCPNPECRKYCVSVMVFSLKREDGLYGARVKLLHQWNLLPESHAKPYPRYIPEAIREDYREACLIRDKSPRASATLSRRCLQGMIRDFWGIKKKTLFFEIQALEEKVDAKTWEAIDAVRRVGKFGATWSKTST